MADYKFSYKIASQMKLWPDFNKSKRHNDSNIHCCYQVLTQLDGIPLTDTQHWSHPEKDVWTTHGPNPVKDLEGNFVLIKVKRGPPPIEEGGTMPIDIEGQSTSSRVSFCLHFVPNQMTTYHGETFAVFASIGLAWLTRAIARAIVGDAEAAVEAAAEEAAENMLMALVAGVADASIMATAGVTALIIAAVCLTLWGISLFFNDKHLTIGIDMGEHGKACFVEGYTENLGPVKKPDDCNMERLENYEDVVMRFHSESSKADEGIACCLMGSLEVNGSAENFFIAFHKKNNGKDYRCWGGFSSETSAKAYYESCGNSNLKFETQGDYTLNFSDSVDGKNINSKIQTTDSDWSYTCNLTVGYDVA